MSGDHKILVGSRKSELALIQTRYVISLLKDVHPEKEFDIVTMSTLGDKVLDIPLPKIGEKSLFTKELETALITDRVKFVVHSLKDLPTSLPEGMAICAVLPREDPRDALVLQKDLSGYTLDTLPSGSVIGTSSLRRTAQLAKKYPHLKVESIRGNLNTRLKKLDDLGKYQAIVLAAAGLIRIGWEDRISKILEQDDILYAVGQGALAVECRADDEETIKLLEPLYDLQTALQITAERSFLKTLGGGCSAPVAVYSEFKVEKANEVRMILTGAVWSLDGKEEIKEKDELNTTVNKKLRCSTCPYNNNSLTRNLNIEDIEGINDCSKCILYPTNEPTPKRQKLDISNEVLSDDPHNLGPIELPVGVDFMGKCPYLETGLVNIHDKFPIKSSTENGSSLKCPFRNSTTAMHLMNNDITVTNFVEITKSDDDKLFCGIVPHKDASVEGMKNARKLGERLAFNMISKGALNIMSKAQSIFTAQLLLVLL
ncbi:hypothetical protein NQ318_000777 [Aromia moschata]|uniref:hydroxymethylbilane synthase n=1 Tax=Aromia moschata TaxID=1265417 RepID=A0AAV8YUY5_9CUCU|nr:hypothetical protein NQ318_000777 [Aromia moschata]